MNKRLLPLLALSLLIGCTFAGENGISVHAVSPWNDVNGYTPVVITVNAPREVTLDVRLITTGPSARATIRVAEGRATRQTVLIPPIGQNWLSLHQVQWSERGGATGTASINQRGHTQVRALLVDPKQEVDLPTLEKELGKFVSGSRSSSSDVIERISAEDLPDRWQAYPDWLVLVLTPRGDAALDEAQRTAITQWIRAGGNMVVSTPELARAWLARGVTVGVDPLTTKGAVLGAALNEHNNHDSWSPEQAPVPGTETVPVKTFVFLALAFALLVGPLNLWWVRKRNARHLFLITTPLASFVTCVVLIVASLLSDGVSVKRSAVQVCLIDHPTQQVVRWTGCTYFAAFSRSSLNLEPQTKLRVLDDEFFSSGGSHHYRFTPMTSNLVLDWRDGQVLSGSVIPARLNRQLTYIEQLPERRRLVVERDGAGYRLTNGLGVALLGAAWRDAKGTVWGCTALASGETVALQAASAGVDVPLDLGDGADYAPAAGTNRLTNNLPSSIPAFATFPTSVEHRIGRDLAQAYDQVRQQPLSFIATLAAPMDPLPGPSSIDPLPPVVIACGRLPLTGGPETAP